MTAKELKKKYLEFFKKKGHAIIPSASLIPEHDPSVLFTTAGMHPLVPYLLGQEHPAGKRLVNVQKSFRTDDINEVGDSWHNTFFEMLGNWSLGDPASPDGIGQGGYWKEEAIGWSIEFLTKELKLDPKRIYVTVFGGDPEIPGVGADEETVKIWKKLGIAENKIFRLGKEDNWWGPVGQTGPCGPDTEMFYDTGEPEHGPDCKPGDNCGKYAEIWNDVFMEFNKTAGGKYEPLKQKNVDTGMGVERTAAVLQKKDNVYDTELFKEAIELVKINSTKFDPGRARRIVDHLRSATFLIAAGINPAGRDDRGSVLNKMLTNTFSYLVSIDSPKGLASNITKIFIDLYENDYEEIKKNQGMVLNQISLFETKYFEGSLIKGEQEKDEFEPIPKMDQAEREKLVAEKSTKILGKGIPFSELNKNYNSLATVSATLGTVSADFKQDQGVPFEDSLRTAKEMYPSLNPNEFENNYWSLLKLHSQRSKEAGGKRFAGGLIDHSEATTKGHTATHLLQQALRDVLGESVHQTGSNITTERIRFDFSQPDKLTEEQIKKVEELVNQKIKEDLPVKREVMSVEEAKKVGAIGLFEEKYGDKVSVYSIGDFSKEICGGPHVGHTGEIGKFKIIKEEALGAGQRRIRAVLE